MGGVIHLTSMCPLYSSVAVGSAPFRLLRVLVLANTAKFSQSIGFQQEAVNTGLSMLQAPRSAGFRCSFSCKRPPC